MKRAAIFVLLLSVGAVAFARQKSAETYPEHGTVVAVQARTKSPGMLLRPGGGLTVTIRRGSYRIETKDVFYEFEEHGRHRSLSINEKIDFRIHGHSAFVEEPNGKEKKSRIIGEEARQAK
ncbi:MAG TPA: hypothetical protein VNJ52_00365 [Patescibacteria group bacterium]|nr:hypothetical protein [Patescibacteria group bacterium]